MKSTPSTSTAKLPSRLDSPHAWLESVYAAKRQRTVELARLAIEALQKNHQRISLATISSMTKLIDPDHKGISESALLNNSEARLHYERSRSWRASKRLRRRPAKPTISPRIIKVDRDTAQVRRQLSRLSKSDLVDRLLSLEQRHAELQNRWLQAQDELLASLLSAK